MLTSDLRSHGFNIVEEVVFCRLDRGGSCAIDLLQSVVAPDHIQRARVELRHDEVAPLVQSSPPHGVARYIYLHSRRKGFAEVLENRGALSYYQRPMAQHRNLVPRIEPLEFVGVGLAGPRLDRMTLVVQPQFQ